MSFRTRLTSFFVLIVIVPMIAVGLLVFRLIDDSAQGKADARANGLASAAVSLFESESSKGRLAAEVVARDLAVSATPRLPASVASEIASGSLVRLLVTEGPRTIGDVGRATALAPGTATIPGANGLVSVTASTVTAGQFARELAGPGTAVVVRSGLRTLAATATAPRELPRQGSVTVGGVHYRVLTQTFPGFGHSAVSVTVLSNVAATSASVQTSRILAAAFIAGFLALALAFSLLATREIQRQLTRFLDAARRLGSGDFSSSVPVEGRDEFAALGQEFNHMSSQLERRLVELQRERARLRESVRRIGQTFAFNLDRPALLDLALSTAVDAVNAESGRLSVRASPAKPLQQAGRVGSLDSLTEHVLAAEAAALQTRELGRSSAGGTFFAAVALGAIEPSGPVRGVITVGRRERQFGDDDLDILRSLAAQTTLALENVDLHDQVRRQAVTDELTGLANHGCFRERLRAEMDQVRRYRYPVGVMMLDLDGFKSINDTYGHQQGDVVLKHVAGAVRDTSRETDVPARYGGEELAVILPHTDLSGAYAIAERVRQAIERLAIPRLEGDGELHITTSVGVAASSDGDEELLIARADAALYAAKRQGKNRSVKAQPEGHEARSLRVRL